MQPLDPVPTERFAVKLAFSNGECRKYVLPLDEETSNDEVVSYHRHVFTDAIWRTVKLIEKHLETSGFFHRGPAITFKNSFCISVMQCYEESSAYSEPVPCDEVIFDNKEYTLRRLWKWNANSMWEDEETGLIKVLLSGTAFNFYGQSTFASPQGKRLCSLDFDYMDSFSDGLSLVCVSGHGYGYVDRNMNFVIPMKYSRAYEFEDGKAKVEKDGAWFFVDKQGKETAVVPSVAEQKYQDVGAYSEGLCRVSTLKLDLMDLAFHSDYTEIAGVWGYIDESGKEIIAPQYIYANDFSGGIAIVCKGKWTIDKKWDNEYNTGRYWTEEELWGAIDKSGDVVIPFIFNEIKSFWDTEDIFMVHYGGWKDGRWGVIDNRGNWLADPVFEDIDYEYQDGLFAFYAKDKWSDPDDVPLGIYDLKQHKVLFEPQFYDVSFRNDGYIEVEVFDTKLGRKIEKLIDRNGKEKFPSIYSSIYTWKKPYEVVIRDEQGDRHGLIDSDGNVILPCKYDVAWNGINAEAGKMIYEENGKQGVRDFDGNIIIAAEYLEIHGLDRPFLTVRVGEKDSYTEGLITQSGEPVLPAEYKRVSWSCDDRIICCADGHCEMLQLGRK